MKHDFRATDSGAGADLFSSWLERETIDSLRRSLGNAEKTQAAIFLFVNRAYEAHMPEERMAGMFGVCLVRAGFPEREEDAAFSLLEEYAAIAAKVHQAP